MPEGKFKDDKPWNGNRKYLNTKRDIYKMYIYQIGAMFFRQDNII